MSLLQIAWRNFCHRSLSSILTTISLALGVGLVVLVLSVYGVISEAFTRNASVGYNLVVGPKGSPLQLTLNSVFYLSQPIENLPYSYYMEFFPQAERAEMVERFGGDSKLGEDDGIFAPYVAGGYAIPLALGDYFGEFRVVGTTPAFFENLRHGPNVDQPFTFSDGRAFEESSEEYGFFEAVIGSRVAAEKNIGVGDKMFPSHGDPEGHSHKLGFTVVGVLDPTGTPNDRAAFVNLEGFYLMEGHAKPIEETEDRESDSSDESDGDLTVDSEATTNSEATTDGDATVTSDPSGESTDGTESDATDGTESDAQALDETSSESTETSSAEDSEATEGEGDAETLRPITIPEREVTSILVRNGNIFLAPGMQNAINEGLQAQAAAPVGEISKLMDAIVGPLLTALLVITLITCVVAAVGVLVAIYNSMNDRRRDIAVMRALGAKRQTVTAIIVMESFLVAVIGALLGWVLAHAAIAIFSGRIEDQTGVQVGFFSLSKYELVVLPLVLCLSAIAALLPAFSAYRTDVATNLQK